MRLHTSIRDRVIVAPVRLVSARSTWPPRRPVRRRGPSGCGAVRAALRSGAPPARASCIAGRPAVASRASAFGRRQNARETRLRPEVGDVTLRRRRVSGDSGRARRPGGASSVPLKYGRVRPVQHHIVLSPPSTRLPIVSNRSRSRPTPVSSPFTADSSESSSEFSEKKKKKNVIHIRFAPIVSPGVTVRFERLMSNFEFWNNQNAFSLFMFKRFPRDE